MPESATQRSLLERFGVESVRSALLHVFLYGLAFLMAVPYLYTVSRSFQATEQLRDPRPYWIPPLSGEPITFEHYDYLLNNTLVIEWTINTFVIAGGATILIVAIDSMVAFSLTRLDWPGQGAIMAIILASFMVPYYMNIVPLYQIVSDLGLINSYWGVILPAAASPLGVFLLYQFFRDIPEEYEEAARLDGFSTFQVYTRIILPLAKPILSALALFMFVYNWNAFLWPLLVLSNETAYTLPIGLVNLYQGNIDTPGLHMAVAIIGSLPLFIIYLLFQGQLVRAVQMQGTTG